MESYNFKLERANDYAQWLQSREWKHFFTWTTPYELTVKGCRRMAERFHERATKVVYDGMDSTMFWVAEKFEAKDGFHMHGLLDYDEHIFPNGNGHEVLTETYQIISGARKKGEEFVSEFKRYNKNRGAGRYCSKYLLKECADFDLYDKNSKLLRPEQISPYRGTPT